MFQERIERRTRTKRPSDEVSGRTDEETRLRRTLDSLLEGCQIVDRQWRYVYVNPAAAQHGGRAVEELIGRTMTDAYPGIENTEMFRLLRRCMERRVCEELENEFIGPDRMSRWFRLVVQPVPEGLFILSLDISDHKRAEIQLRKSRAQLVAVIENVQEGLIIADLDGRLLHWNPAAIRMHGLTTAEEGQRAYADFGQMFAITTAEGAPVPLEQWPMARVLRGERVESVELRIHRKEGKWERIFVYDGGIVNYDDGDALAFLAIRDITTERALEAQFLQAQKLEAVGLLAGGIAHDFNNMLFVVFNRCEALLKTLPADDRRHKYAQEILAASRHSADLTQQLLAVARRQIMQPDVVPFAPLVESMIPLFKRTIGDSIIIRMINNDDSWRVFADASKIRQALMNLVINARDAMPAGGTLTIEVRNFVADSAYVRTHPQIAHGEYATLAVSDTGIGIPEDIRDRIFDPFFTTKASGKGSGLGLSVVRGIVEQTGGHMTVYSEPGRGTTFKLFFPRYEGDVEQLLAASERASGDVRGSETILLVEDDDLVREVLRDSIEDQGYRVLEAPNAGSALELAGRHEGPIDVLITDVTMPGMSGPALATKLLAQRPQVIVVCMSGYTDTSITDHTALERDFVFVEKPIMVEALLKQIRKLLQQEDRPSAA